MTSDPLLQVRQLTTCIKKGKKSYPVVHQLSFNLYKGKTLALVGESGCGKTMTALSILRILPHRPTIESTGEVIYENTNLLTLREKQMHLIRGKKIAMVFQDPMSALNPVYTIGYQLLQIIEYHLGNMGKRGWQIAISALSEVGLASPEAIMEAYPHQISGGMKQRAMIAMALLCSPIF